MASAPRCCRTLDSAADGVALVPADAADRLAAQARQECSPATGLCVALLSGWPQCRQGALQLMMQPEALRAEDPALLPLLAVLLSQDSIGQVVGSPDFALLCTTALADALPHPSLLPLYAASRLAGASSHAASAVPAPSAARSVTAAALLPALASQLCCAGHQSIAAALVARQLRLHGDLATHDGAGLLLHKYLAACNQASLPQVRLPDFLSPWDEGEREAMSAEAQSALGQASGSAGGAGSGSTGSARRPGGISVAGSVQRLFGTLATGAHSAVKKLMEDY